MTAQLKRGEVWLTRSWGEPIHQLRQELGLSPVGNPIVDDKFSPYLVLALFSSVLGAPQPDWTGNTVVTGFLFYYGNQQTGLVQELKRFLTQEIPQLFLRLVPLLSFLLKNFIERVSKPQSS